MTNMTLWQLAELLKAGWAVQAIPVPPPAGRSAHQVMIQFVRERASSERTIDDEDLFFPVTDWVALGSFEKDLGEVVEQFYQRVFPMPDLDVGLNA